MHRNYFVVLLRFSYARNPCIAFSYVTYKSVIFLLLRLDLRIECNPIVKTRLFLSNSSTVLDRPPFLARDFLPKTMNLYKLQHRSFPRCYLYSGHPSCLVASYSRKGFVRLKIEIWSSNLQLAFSHCPFRFVIQLLTCVEFLQ